jgi:hypothetical protein
MIAGMQPFPSWLPGDEDSGFSVRLPSESVATVTAVSQKYWDRFGEGFVASIENLSVKPQEVILVTRARVDVPDWWTIVPYWDDRIWPAVNVGVREAKSEWVMQLPVDDLLDRHFYNYLVLEGDAVNVRGRWDGGLCYGTPEQYDNLLNMRNNGMPGQAIIRRKVWLKYPYRAHKYADWVQWCELRAHNVTVTFDSRCIWTWVRHDDATTFQPDHQAERDVIAFCNWLKAGRVIPGEEWPPKLIE